MSGHDFNERTGMIAVAAGIVGLLMLAASLVLSIIVRQRNRPD